jgi:acyl-CoA thioester hydrolase
MLLHVDTTNGAKSATFDADIAGRIEAMLRDVPNEAPKEARYAGRVIGLPSGPRAVAPASTGVKPA